MGGIRQLGHRQKKGTQFSCGSEPAAAFSSGPGGGFYSFMMPGFSFGVCARVLPACLLLVDLGVGVRVTS